MKKVISAVICIALAISLFSCAKKSEREKNETGTSKSQTTMVSTIDETIDETARIETSGENTRFPIDDPLDGSEGLEYVKVDKHYSVVGIGTCTDENLVIPTHYMGDSVTSISDRAFENCTFIKSLTIPDCVTYIGDAVCMGCSGLEKMDVPFLPGGLLHYMFENATFLESQGPVDLTAYSYFVDRGIDVIDGLYSVEIGLGQDGNFCALLPASLISVTVRGGKLGRVFTTCVYEQYHDIYIEPFERITTLTEFNLPLIDE